MIMNIEIATFQELFNIMWTGLSGQGWEQSVKKGRCAYRGNGELKCAIGHCIDYETAIDWEGSSIADIAEDLQLSSKRILFLTTCQFVHDRYQGIQMKNRFQDIASEYNLTIPGA
jgi:hypothetical protein